MSAKELKDAEDAELIIAVLADNLEAFDELVLRYQRAMLTVAQQIVRNPTDAEDIVQDAFLLAFEALPQLENLNRFGSWLYSITRNRALRFMKRASKFQLHEDIEAELQVEADPASSDPAKILVQQSTHEAIRDAINSLPPEFQEVIKLYYWVDMPQKRIAEFLSLPLTTVKWRLHKAKDLLKSLLEKRGYGEIL
ncbi:MAG: RNA polymerase sigma factor [Candidatus Poribacteria bacterium]|nr:RNA polymerase sigma factor [Candidatus Poribacteria bacterium]